QRGAFLHFLDRAADLFLLVPLGEITEADDADRLAALIADENARDLPVLHQLRDLVHVLVGPHARHVLRHRLFHARTLEISALGDEPDDDVAIRDRADRLPGRIDDWQESDVFIGHQTSDLLNARLAADGPHVLLHEILHAHVVSRFVGTPRKMRTCRRARQRRAGRCLPAGTTHVPTARQTTTGGSSTAAAESDRSGLGEITFRASKRILRLVLPTATISPSTSTKSPVCRGARNST